MVLPLLLSFLCLVHAEDTHIYDVDQASLPILHQKSLLSSLASETKRRSLLEVEGFFKLTGVLDAEEKEHAFVLKRADHTPLIDEGDKVTDAATLNRALTFYGYAAHDYSVISVLSFDPNENATHPRGNVHYDHPHYWENVDGYGLSLRKHNMAKAHQGAQGAPNCQSKGDTHLHSTVLDHLKHLEEEDAELMEGLRESVLEAAEKAREKRANGLTGDNSLYYVELAILTDNPFHTKTNKNKVTALNYLNDIISGINAIYERDIRATLVITYVYYSVFGDVPPRTAELAFGDKYGIYAIGQWLTLRQAAMPLLDLMDRADVTLGLYYTPEDDPLGATGEGWIGTVCRKGAQGAYAVSAIMYTYWDKTAWNTKSDILLPAHELGHVLGSMHTHELPKWFSGLGQSLGYSPRVDSCETAKVLPSKGAGTIMSYCYLVGSPAGSNVWYPNKSVLYMGLDDQGYGKDSVRVNQQIRSIMTKFGFPPAAPKKPTPGFNYCLSTYKPFRVVDPSIVICQDLPDPTRSRVVDGVAKPISCFLEKVLGFCNVDYMQFPFCNNACEHFGCKAPTTCVDIPPGYIYGSPHNKWTCAQFKATWADFCTASWWKKGPCAKTCGLCKKRENSNGEVEEEHEEPVFNGTMFGVPRFTLVQEAGYF